MGLRLFWTVLVCCVLTSGSVGQCVQDNRTNRNGGIVVNDLSIESPTKLTSDELAGIATRFTGSCF